MSSSTPMDWEARPRLQSEPISFRISSLQQLIRELLVPNIPVAKLKYTIIQIGAEETHSY